MRRVDRRVEVDIPPPPPFDPAPVPSWPLESFERLLPADAAEARGFLLLAPPPAEEPPPPPATEEDARLRPPAGEAAEEKWSSPSCARRAAFSAMIRWRSCSLLEGVLVEAMRWNAEAGDGESGLLGVVFRHFWE